MTPERAAITAARRRFLHGDEVRHIDDRQGVVDGIVTLSPEGLPHARVRFERETCLVPIGYLEKVPRALANAVPREHLA